MTDDLNFDPEADYSADPSKRWIGVNLDAGNKVHIASVFAEKPLSGPVVLKVVHDGPAHRAGIKVGDMIVQVNHAPVTSPELFDNFLQNRQIGEVVIVGISREDYIRQLKVQIAGAPDDQRLLSDAES